MKLQEWMPTTKSCKKSKRVGRGTGSGHGKTACRGQKGQKAHGKVRVGFEGGQTPLYKRLPKKKGFRNIFRRQYTIVNLTKLERFESGTEITPQLLLEHGMIKNLKNEVKILGDGQINKPLTVKAHKFSRRAVDKIEASGGKTIILGVI